MSANVHWYGDQFLQALEAEQRKRLTRAAVMVQREAKRNLSVSGTGVRNGGRIVRAVKRTRKTIYGAFPSSPGEFPHKQTGNLRMNVTYDVTGSGSDVKALVGVTALATYARYLWADGPRRRLGLPESLNNVIGQVRSILTAPWKH